MGKFANFLYKISNVVFITISMILLTLIAAVTGWLLTQASDPERVYNFVKGIVGDNQDLKENIVSLLKGIHWSTKDLSGVGIALLTTFSICTGLIGLFVVFGILSVHYRRKIGKEGRKALKEKKNGGATPDMSDAYYDYSSNQKYGY